MPFNDQERQVRRVTTVTADDLPLALTHEVRDYCLCLHLQRAARAIARRFDDAFRPYGLTNGQFSLLISLNRPLPPRMGDVSDLLGMDRTTLTAALKPLRRAGYMEIVADPGDGRSRLLLLTPTGSALLRAVVPVWRQTLTDVGAGHPGVDLEAGLTFLADLASPD